MTDRHIHCVFCEQIQDDRYKCIKHHKYFPHFHHPYDEGWFDPHCEDYIPKPCLLLSYYIYESKNFSLEKREDCYKEANEFLKKHKLIRDGKE